MLPAQAAALGVTSATHDQMETDETKKRAREASTDGTDVDGDHRSYIAYFEEYHVGGLKARPLRCGPSRKWLIFCTRPLRRRSS